MEAEEDVSAYAELGRARDGGEIGAAVFVQDSGGQSGQWVGGAGIRCGDSAALGRGRGGVVLSVGLE